jgi:hypothetical protein
VGVLHGSKSYVLQDEHGQILEAHSISAGLDYPGVGPEHAELAASGRAEYQFATDDEALAIANGTDYGLGSGLWTRDLQRAHRFARELHAGMVWINSYKRVNPGSPFGGVGQSGYGREMGFDAMREYTQVKSVWVNVDAQIPAWYPR